MANIEMQYLVPFCSRNHYEHCTQCHTQAACDLGCRDYYDGEDDPNAVSFGDCAHAHYKTAYKGLSIKKYDILEQHDPWHNPSFFAEVKVGTATFMCSKVTLNGEVVYDSDAE